MSVQHAQPIERNGPGNRGGVYSDDAAPPGRGSELHGHARSVDRERIESLEVGLSCLTLSKMPVRLIFSYWLGGSEQTARAGMFAGVGNRNCCF